MRHYEKRIQAAKRALSQAEHILIGAGAGLSAAAGITYSGERFTSRFADFIAKYHLTDMYSATFTPFPTEEERWAYWARHIYVNRYEPGATLLYQKLYNLVRDKDCFVITTNVESQFAKAGFAPERIFEVQGNYAYLQCAHGCHDTLYYNEELVMEMMRKTQDCAIPSALVPTCPVCGGKMAVHLRCDNYFVEDAAWHEAYGAYTQWLRQARGPMVLLELGVGYQTPGIIKYPFWRMTVENPRAMYLCINKGEAYAPRKIMDQSICISGDIEEIL